MDNSEIDNNFIPCEICNQLIIFENYITHLDNCFFNRTPMILSPISQVTQASPISELATFINNFVNSGSNITLNHRIITRTINNNSTVERQSFINGIPFTQSNLPFSNNILNNGESNRFIIGRIHNNSNNLEDNLEDNLENMFGQIFQLYMTNLVDLNIEENEENVPNFIEDINTVSNIIIFENIIDKEKDCPICLESFNILNSLDNNRLYRTTLCNHIFCDICITKWLSISKKCPYCNENLEDLYNSLDEDYQQYDDGDDEDENEYEYDEDEDDDNEDDNENEEENKEENEEENKEEENKEEEKEEENKEDIENIDDI
jgi:formate dehydrogenase maturation protein FdhE